MRSLFSLKDTNQNKDGLFWYERFNMRFVKSALFFLTDLFLIPICLFTAFFFRLGDFFSLEVFWQSFALNYYGIAAGIVTIYAFKSYRVKLRSFDFDVVARIGASAVLLTVFMIVASYLLDLWVPRSVPFIFGVVFFCSSIAARLGAIFIFNLFRSYNRKTVPVAIYGAGAAGIQLASALRQSDEIKPVIFVDDNPTLHSLIVSGLKVRGPGRLRKMAAQKKIERVLIAIPSLSLARRKEILDNLEDVSCTVQIIPSYVDLISGVTDRGPENQPISPDELLGRETVDLDVPEVARAFAGRNVMVTGAGGSIGSELCQQIINRRPACLILFEQNEFALYEIDRRLRKFIEDEKIELVSCLGSCCDEKRVCSVIRDHNIEIILHAAAYKHVPLLEENEVQAIQNNILGTKVVAQAAFDAKIERFILVSTDKAVRPANIMGATKRVAELVVQDLQSRSDTTKLATVRFGNVLGSSGSVIPLFQEQIAEGGPITVTDPNVTRFFMTISEASRLVLLAGSFATGGDVFVLDMGEPVKIVDLAKRMIALSGGEADETHTNPDAIQIEFIGLRPGEKLYEELLIADSSLTETPHPKIMRAKEEQLTQVEVVQLIKKLTEAIAKDDVNGARRALSDYVSGYKYPPKSACVV